MAVEAKPWLEPTRKLIDRLDESALPKSDRALLDSAILQLQTMLGGAVTLDWNAADAGLRKLFTTAFQLFRSLHRAKALFQVQMTHAVLPRQKQQPSFQPDTMSDINNIEDEGVLAGRPIEASVFPGICKFGDELGENVSKKSTIAMLLASLT